MNFYVFPNPTFEVQVDRCYVVTKKALGTILTSFFFYCKTMWPIRPLPLQDIIIMCS